MQFVFILLHENALLIAHFFRPKSSRSLTMVGFEAQIQRLTALTCRSAVEAIG